MNKNERSTLLLLALLLLLGSLFWMVRGPRKPTEAPLPAAPVIPAAPVATTEKPTGRLGDGETKIKAVAPRRPVPPSPRPPLNPASPPPPVELHKELIPKNIEIIRCYYDQQIVPPATTFGFDINGSGFTTEFQEMIQVSAENPHIHIKNLRLVTANQIHGDMEVDADAATAFVYPRVLIKKLPVFSAPEPFAVVRKGEVLTIVFISMEENGRAGRFRVITNLDDAMAKQFRVETSTAGLDIADMVPYLPYRMEGTLRINQSVPPGGYGMSALLGDKKIYSRDGIIRIVRPNVGLSGYIQAVAAEDPYHRPGDEIQLYLHGTGLASRDINALSAKIDEFDMGKGSFTYLSGVQMRLTFIAPPQTPIGSYGITVSGQNGQSLYQKSDLFKIVPANWVAGVQVTPPVKPGQKSLLKIVGRDFSQEFAQALQIQLDEPGIQIQNLHGEDASTITADILVSSAVAPGDYWLHLSSDGQKITPPYGSLIKVEKPF